MVQWLGLHAVTDKGAGSIPGRGTEIPQAAQCGLLPTKSELRVFFMGLVQLRQNWVRYGIKKGSKAAGGESVLWGGFDPKCRSVPVLVESTAQGLPLEESGVGVRRDGGTAVPG